MSRQVVRSYRAKSLHDALGMIRKDLGPQAAVLNTKHVWDGFLRGLFGKRRVEVTAALPATRPQLDQTLGQQLTFKPDADSFPTEGLCIETDPLSRLEPGLSEVRQRWGGSNPIAFRLYTELVEAEFLEQDARELVQHVQAEFQRQAVAWDQAWQRLQMMITSAIRVSGPLHTTPGTCRTVALVGPTGVGKTTTIAKLAANLRLREKKQVGLITVDTYRIAAVEQLRTYADIIDLPMEVVSTPREMREAMHRMEHLDLVLMDTAGRSPRDEIKLQELKVMLAEAGADEVHLVMSATAGNRALATTAAPFSGGGAPAMLHTKHDEATGLGHHHRLLRDCPLPVSYLTNGQNVPEDIQVASADRLAGWMLGHGRDGLAEF
ncbi:MAG: flagellar GTP-binding protein [Planctomycetota bacterium]